MSILVCGGAGYVGSHTVAELVERGYDTVVVDNLEKGHAAAVWPGAKFYQGDLRDANFLDRVFAAHTVTAVIDFAAYSLVGESMENPMKYYENNVVGTMELLKAMLKRDVKHIVFSSTASTYGVPENIPLLETDHTEPINAYGETKLTVEKMFKWYENAYGLKYVTLRYFNVAGAHRSGNIGEDHHPETHIIPNVLRAALGQEDALRLYGDDYPTADGTCIRDYVHATDLADAHIRAVEKLSRDHASAVYNLGSGKGYSVKEIIDTAKSVTGRAIPVIISPRRPGDPPVLVASSEKIIRELGWSRQYDGLEEMIGSAWKWHLNHPKGFA